jgi:hypothetical protein
MIKYFIKVLNFIDRKLHDIIWLELSKYSREDRRELYGNQGMFVRIDVLKKTIKSLPPKLRVLETISFYVSRLTKRLERAAN